jgi:WD40 repeat protein
LKHTKIISKAGKEWISEVKFSPDGSLLAVGSHDNSVYIYNVQGWQKKWAFNKHASFITHLDWSEDGNSIHTNTGDYELLYWDVSKGTQETSGRTKYKDENWATWTCAVGWPTQGIWPPGAGGDDIDYVCRSNSKTVGGYNLLAVGDDFGKVSIYRYPCVQKNSQSVKQPGHSSHVTCVKFGPKDDYLFSTGGEDNCVFQWKVTPQSS